MISYHFVSVHSLRALIEIFTIPLLELSKFAQFGEALLFEETSERGVTTDRRTLAHDQNGTRRIHTSI